MREDFMKDKELALRLIRDDLRDYQLIYKWYQIKDVYTSFEQRPLSLDEVKQKYKTRTLASSLIPVFMILYAGKPIGIIQYQLVSAENKELYGLTIPDVYEIDIFIGETAFFNKGIGRRSVNLLAEYLIQQKKANLLVMCPLKSNERAIKCYQNCGFQIKKELKLEDTVGKLKDYVLMTKDGRQND